MSLGARRGAAAVELAVALVMLGVVAAVLLRLLAANLRLYQSQTQRLDRRQALRTAELILPAELSELDAPDGDLLAIGPTSVTIRAPRQLAFVCAPAGPGARALAVRRRPFFGARDFAPATDRLLALVSDSAAVAGEMWVEGALTGTSGGTCADGAPARLLETPLAADARIAVGAPVRGWEIVTYRLYRGGDGEWYVGIVEGGGAAQPVFGPVTPDGFALRYLDAQGLEVSAPSLVAAIEVRVRAPTAQPVSGGGSLVRERDSTTFAVALRNNSPP